MLDVMNQQMLDRFNATHKVDLIAQVRGRARHRCSASAKGSYRRRPTQAGAIWDDRARGVRGAYGVLQPVGLLEVRPDSRPASRP